MAAIKRTKTIVILTFKNPKASRRDEAAPLFTKGGIFSVDQAGCEPLRFYRPRVAGKESGVARVDNSRPRPQTRGPGECQPNK